MTITIKYIYIFLGPSLSVGGVHTSTPSLANLHSNSCGSPSFSKDLANSSEGSLKVAKSGKPVNRWSGLWGSSSKVSKNFSKMHLSTVFIMILEIKPYGLGPRIRDVQAF